MQLTMKHKTTGTKPHQVLRATIFATLLASLTLSGCATVGGGTPQEQVSQRADERWKALVAGDFSRAYSYNTPGYRAVVTPESYRGRIGGAIKWVGAETVKVNCPEATTCIATVRLDYQPLLGGIKGTFDTHIEETWLHEDGRWWIFQPIKGN